MMVAMATEFRSFKTFHQFMHVALANKERKEGLHVPFLLKLGTIIILFIKTQIFPFKLLI